MASSPSAPLLLPLPFGRASRESLVCTCTCSAHDTPRSRVAACSPCASIIFTMRRRLCCSRVRCSCCTEPLRGQTATSRAASCFFCCVPRSTRGSFLARLRRWDQRKDDVNAFAACVCSGSSSAYMSYAAASQLDPARLHHPCTGSTPDSSFPARLVRRTRMMLTHHDLGAHEYRRLPAAERRPTVTPPDAWLGQ